jgi:DNA-binding transcriptional MocR family regulator
VYRAEWDVCVGCAFYKDNIDQAALRLSFAAPGVADIETGVQGM